MHGLEFVVSVPSAARALLACLSPADAARLACSSRALSRAPALGAALKLAVTRPAPGAGCAVSLGTLLAGAAAGRGPALAEEALMALAAAAELHTAGDHSAGQLAEVLRDVARTFPGHPLFSHGAPRAGGGDEGEGGGGAAAWADSSHVAVDPWATPGLYGLMRVLVGFTAARPGVGYAQGVNYVAAAALVLAAEPRLVAHRDRGAAAAGPGGGGGGGGALRSARPRSPEQSLADALALLIALSDGYGCADLWRGGLPRVPYLGFALSECSRRHAPLLHEHLTRVGFSFDVFAAQWLLPLGATILPAGTLRCVWRAFVGCGWKALLRVCVALLQRLEPRVVGGNMDVGDVSALLRDWRDAIGQAGRSSQPPPHHAATPAALASSPAPLLARSPAGGGGGGGERARAESSSSQVSFVVGYAAGGGGGAPPPPGTPGGAPAAGSGGARRDGKMPGGEAAARAALVARYPELDVLFDPSALLAAAAGVKVTRSQLAALEQTFAARVLESRVDAALADRSAGGGGAGGPGGGAGAGGAPPPSLTPSPYEHVPLLVGIARVTVPSALQRMRCVAARRVAWREGAAPGAGEEPAAAGAGDAAAAAAALALARPAAAPAPAGTAASRWLSAMTASLRLAGADGAAGAAAAGGADGGGARPSLRLFLGASPRGMRRTVNALLAGRRMAAVATAADGGGGGGGEAAGAQRPPPGGVKRRGVTDSGASANASASAGAGAGASTPQSASSLPPSPGGDGALPSPATTSRPPPPPASAPAPPLSLLPDIDSLDLAALAWPAAPPAAPPGAPGGDGGGGGAPPRACPTRLDGTPLAAIVIRAITADAAVIEAEAWADAALLTAKSTAAREKAAAAGVAARAAAGVQAAAEAELTALLARKRALTSQLLAAVLGGGLAPVPPPAAALTLWSPRAPRGGAAAGGGGVGAARATPPAATPSRPGVVARARAGDSPAAAAAAAAALPPPAPDRTPTLPLPSLSPSPAAGARDPASASAAATTPSSPAGSEPDGRALAWGEPAPMDMRATSSSLAALDAALAESGAAWKAACWQATLAATRSEELAAAADALMRTLVETVDAGRARRTALATQAWHALEAAWEVHGGAAAVARADAWAGE